jgi:hypothetical protein
LLELHACWERGDYAEAALSIAREAFDARRTAATATGWS